MKYLCFIRLSTIGIRKRLGNIILLINRYRKRNLNYDLKSILEYEALTNFIKVLLEENAV